MNLIDKMKQKFKRGNLVEVVRGHYIWKSDGTWIDIAPEEVGRKAIIEHSYAEKYSGKDVDSYSIVFLDTGTSLAWKKTNELKLIDKGGEHLFKEAEKNRKEIHKKDTSPKYLCMALEKGILNYSSMLFLFKMLGYKSKFSETGEFYYLQKEWQQLHPIFLHIKKSKSLKEAQAILNSNFQKKFNVKRVYDFFKSS